jgi:hypothetical protein
MEMKRILEDIRTKPVVPIWPHAGKALGLGRASAYSAARRNEIDVVRHGRLIRAVSASLRARLKIEAA